MQRVLLRLADSISTAQSLEELARPLLEMASTVTGLESTYLTSIDEGQGVLRVEVARNAGALQIAEGTAVPWHDTLCKRALDEGLCGVNDVAGRWGESSAARALGIQSYASVPVTVEDGRLFGTLCGASAGVVPLPEHADRMLRMFARLLGQHIEREHLLEQLKAANAELGAQALVDALTGLPNRRALLIELARMLARAERDGTTVCIAFVDLDGFKRVNDDHGHAAGDRFLIAIGARLTTSLRGGDVAGRYGGDEFVVLAQTDTAESAPLLQQRVAEATCGPFALGEQVVLDYAGASVGVVTASATETPEELLLRADQAMYEVKRRRRKATAPAG